MRLDPRKPHPRSQLLIGRAPILVLSALLFALVACQSGTVTGPEVTLNLGFDPPTMDPAQVTDPPTIQAMRLLFLNLLDLNEAEGSPVPSLATEWFVSADGLIWEFHLRTDATWVRFSPLTGRSEKQRAITADDVVYSVRRIFDPRSVSSFAPLFASLIRNADALNRADPRTRPEDLDRLAEQVGIRALDDHTVQFFLTRPHSGFPALVAAWLGRIQPREPISNNGLSWTDPGFIWTSGPFMLERWDRNQTLNLRKNPFFFRADQVQIERIHLVMIPDASLGLDAYSGGNLDSTDPFDGLTGDLAERVNQDPSLSSDAHLTPSLCTQYLAFNIRVAPYDDVRVRQALALAVNHKAEAELVGSGTPARWFAPPSILAAPALSDTLGLAYNPTQAKALFDQAGYGLGKRPFPSGVIDVPANELLVKSAVSIADNWKKTLGVDMRVESKSVSDLLKDISQNPIGVFRLGYCAAYPDASSFFLDRTLAGLPYEYTRWARTDFQDLIERAARETDLARRRDLYRQAEKILVQDDAVVIPLIWSTRLTLTAKKFERDYAIMEGYDRIENWRVKSP